MTAERAVRIVTGTVHHPPPEPYPRLLVTRGWPPGTARGAVDQWDRDLGPSEHLLAALHAGRLSRKDFERRYAEEMRARPSLLAWAARMAAATGVALLCACRTDRAGEAGDAGDDSDGRHDTDGDDGNDGHAAPGCGCHRDLLGELVRARAAHRPPDPPRPPRLPLRSRRHPKAPARSAHRRCHLLYSHRCARRDVMADQTCIVCGKAFDAEKGLKWNYEGTWYLFNDLGCRNRFIGNPSKYLESAQPA